jgi:hypothetical protein
MHLNSIKIWNSVLYVPKGILDIGIMPKIFPMKKIIMLTGRSEDKTVITNNPHWPDPRGRRKDHKEIDVIIISNEQL